MATTYDFFISYPHKEREWVRRFVEALEHHNLKIWYDEKSFPLLPKMCPSVNWFHRFAGGGG